MKNVWRLSLVSLVGLFFVGTTLALPAKNQPARQPAQATAQTQSVSGKIASVNKDSFTLTVGSGMETVSAQESNARTMAFSIDKNTTVEGTLKVGSSADVTYRTENGANIAISVHVTP